MVEGVSQKSKSNGVDIIFKNLLSVIGHLCRFLSGSAFQGRHGPLQTQKKEPLFSS